MEVGSVIELIVLLRGALKAAVSHAQKRQLRVILENLEIVFFTPHETRRTIDRALSKELTAFQVQEFAQQFDRNGPRVQASLQFLEHALSEAGVEIPLRDRELLHRISSEKLSIRREIREGLYDPLIRGEALDFERVKRLRSDVEGVNVAIAELDNNLRR